MQDKIIYTAIIRKKKSVLCEYTEYSGKFAQITKKVLQILNSVDNPSTYRATFSFGKYQFTLLFDNAIYYLAMSNKISINSYQENYLFAFVYKLSVHLKNIYTIDHLSKCHPYSLTDFVNVIEENSSFFNKKSKNKFEDFIQRAVDIEVEKEFYKKRYECDIDFAIMAPEEVHEDNPKDFDPVEIRASTYIKYKIPQEQKENNQILDTSLNSSMSEYCESFVTTGEHNINVKKRFSCCKWIILIGLVLCVIGITLGALFGAKVI